MTAKTSRPGHLEDGIVGARPTDWYGVTLPDGDAGDFAVEPVGSIYTYLDRTYDRARTFVKRKNDALDNDWGIHGGVHCITRTITRASMTDGLSTSGTYVLAETIPVGAWVLRTVLVNVTGFTGDTSAAIIVGDGTDTDRYNTGTPSVFTTANAIDLGAPSGTQIHTAAGTVTITITSGADFTNVTAGTLTIKIFYLL